MAISYPPAYASANPAVAALFGNEMAINRARATDEQARQQMELARQQQAAETIYRQQALRQQNEQQQMNAFLSMLQNAQRQSEGRNEIAARERIAGLPYGPTAIAEAQAERDARIKAAEIAAKRIDPWFAREQYQVQQDEKAIAEETTAKKAQLDSIAEELNQAVQKANAERLKSHEDLDKKTTFKWGPGRDSVESRQRLPEHANIDAAFVATLKQLKDSIAKNFQGLLVLKNNRFQVNAAALGVPAIRVPQVPPPAGTNAVSTLPQMTNSLPIIRDWDPVTGTLTPGR